MVLFPGKAYNEIKVGDSFGSAMTVTETHLVLAAGLFGDFNPPHTSDHFLAAMSSFFFSSSLRRSTRRCTFPVVVMGSASINSISFGYS